MLDTREDVALAFLGATSLKALRAAVRRDRQWAGAFGGFRPDSLTTTQFLSRAAWYAADVTRLEALCGVFLEDHGAARKGSLRERLAAVAADPDAAAEVRELCRAAAEVDWRTLPASGSTRSDQPAAGEASATAQS